MSDLLRRAYRVSESVEAAIKEAEGAETPSAELMTRLIGVLETHDDLVSEIAAWHELAEAEERGIEAHYAPILERIEADKKALKRRREFLRMVLEQLLPPGPDSALTTDKVSLFYSPSESVDIYDEDSVPLQFTEVKSTVVKSAVKQALKSGKEVPGARLLQNWNLQIKQGGANAKVNERKRRKERSTKNIEAPGPTETMTDDVSA